MHEVINCLLIGYSIYRTVRGILLEMYVVHVMTHFYHVFGNTEECYFKTHGP